MAENLGKWLSKRRPISKIRPSDGCGRDAVPLAVERSYDFHGFGCQLGNVGSDGECRLRWGMSAQMGNVGIRTHYAAFALCATNGEIPVIVPCRSGIE